MSDQDKSRSKLQEQFAKAHDGLVTPPVSEAPKRERISATYELEGTHGSEKLDKASVNFQAQFSKAANPPQPAPSQEPARVNPVSPARGGPESYHPKAPSALGLNRTTAGQRLSDYDNYLKQLNKAAIAREQPENGLQSNNDRTRDTERGG